MTENKTRLPRILFAAPSSGSGKTTLVCGILEAWKQQGVSLTSFKCGPDYIDSMFHHYVLGISGYNLDSFFLEEDQLRSQFLKQAETAELSVIEGVMGYYDGIGGIQVKASTYDIACITDTPVILIIDGKGSSLSIVALIKGFLEFQKDSHVAGVILNRTSPGMAKLLKPYVEELGLVLYGAVPECKEAMLESRHLGLTLPKEQHRLLEQIQDFSDKLKQWVNLDGLMALAKEAPDFLCSMTPVSMELSVRETFKTVFRMGVARDEAFCFYYQENLEFLESIGCELIPFSPLRDSGVPCNLDGILLGGGYPELYAKQLSGNQAMLASIRDAAKRGIKILGECGGFLYLHRTLEDLTGAPYEMAGVVDGNGFKTDRLSRFGYIEVESSLGNIKAHEFHYWDSTSPGLAMKAVKPGSNRTWECMHLNETIMAGFPHLYYLSAPQVITRFLLGEVCL